MHRAVLQLKLFALTFSLTILFLGLPVSGMAFDVGPLSIGGAIRANYYLGDYTDPSGSSPSRPSRADDDGGTIALDTFRINLDYAQGPWVGKVEYRFYPGYAANNSDGYHFLHTGWGGYNFEDKSQVQVGVNRVPFGPGPYGISQSWFFDQHFYVGLSDDMDLGVKYTKPMGPLTVDMAYYYSNEGNYYGASEDSSRYSYDVVDESGTGYEERNQVNLRAIYAFDHADVGMSLQYGQLKSNGPQDDGDHFAASVHAVPKFGNWTLAMQLTYYSYNVEADQPLGTDKLVQFGAYDFPTIVAAEAYIPAVSLSYKIETPQLDWLDYVLPYVEYSSIMKAESSFNDSTLVTAGAAWASGGWYIYSEVAYSNGNDFVGNEAGYGSPPAGLPYWASDRFGTNTSNEWEYRVNINLGYYF
jgi:hypothetical protein